MNDQMMSHTPAPAMISQPPPVPVPVQAMMNPVMAPLPGGMFVAQQQQRGGYKPWQQNPNPNAGGKFNNNKKNWKGKNVNKDQRRMEIPNMPFGNPAGMAAGGGYQPPSLNELQNQNRMKARKYYHPKKKFNKSEGGGGNRGGGIHRNNNRFAPYAPRNTSSFIIRAKKAGGIAELVSPYPVTPAVLPTPIFSPSREVLGDMAKEEWGVDGYGSMKGLIRLRSPTEGGEGGDEDDEEGNGSSESDVEEHVEVERRLDHDLSRFEMIYPTGEYGYGGGFNNVLENRVDDQDSHIAQLEEENLTLKERLFLMERELGDLRRRMQFLERQQFRHGREDASEEVVENMSENDDNESDGGSDARGVGNDGQEDVLECVGGGDSGSVRDASDSKERNDQCTGDADTKKLPGCDVAGGSSEEGRLVDGAVAADAAVSKDLVMCEDTELEKVMVPNPGEDLSLEDADTGKEAVHDGSHAERDGSKEED